MNLPRALGVHIYAGGFTTGMRDNLDVIGHKEISNFGVETCKANLRIEPEIRPDGRWSLPEGKINVVYGNPPCVAFSRLGHREYLEHPTIADVRSLLALGLQARPEVWVWECVPQAYSKGGPLIDEVREAWQKAGYHCTVFLTDINLYGAAQRRARFHFIAHRVKLNFEVPDESKWGGPCGEALKQVKPEIDVKNLQVRRYLQWMEAYATPGHALRKVWFHLHGLNQNEQKPEGLRFCPPFCIQRLYESKPSPTLTGGPDFVHPTEWRVLSPGEMAHLCGFPSTWKWLGNVVDRYKQVAKGVTPALGRYLGKVFRDGVESGQGVESAGFEVIDHRGSVEDRWRGVKPERLNPEWFGIAENNKIKEDKQLKLEETSA